MELHGIITTVDDGEAVVFLEPLGVGGELAAANHPAAGRYVDAESARQAVIHHAPASEFIAVGDSDLAF
jgi:hypothetical protein